MRARDNPFTVERIHGLRYRFPPGESREGLLARLAALGWRGAFVGGEGRGKSTLLAELGEYLETRGLEVRRLALARGQTRIGFGEETALLDGIGPRVALLLDGAEQLHPWRWRRLRRRAEPAGAFLVTSHREGLLPTALRCTTPPRVLARLLDELAPSRGASFPTAEALHARHDGDVRQALFEAYDVCAAS